VDGSVEQLLTVDPGTLSYDEQLDHLVELHALEARVAARKQHTLAAIDSHEPTDASIDSSKEWHREEVACVLTIAPGFAATLLCQATRLVNEFPATLRLLEAGVLSFAHARTLLDQCLGLESDVAARVEADALLHAGSCTVSQFRATIRRAVLRHDVRSQETKENDARSRRRVALEPDRYGMTWLSAYLETADAERIMARVAAVAGRPAPGDERTCDQRRADAFVALLTGSDGCPVPSKQGRNLSVGVLIDYATLLGAAERPGELGSGPISATTARALAFDPTATWRWHVLGTDGQVLRIGRPRRAAGDSRDVAKRLPRVRDELVDGNGRLRAIPGDKTEYEPSARLHDTVVARDRTCRFPGCRRRATRTELDHIVPFNGRNTVLENLQCLCARHHHLKHEAGWQVRRGTDGVTEWRSPTGRGFRTIPTRWAVEGDPP
jgi:hypothetical protein